MFDAIRKQNTTPKLRCVGRLSRNNYISGGKLVSSSTFTLLKRKSNLSLQDMVCDVEDIDKLELSTYEEGLYEIITYNHSTDWETGVIDDWDIKLIPYKEEQ